MAHKRQGFRFENDWEPEMSLSDATYVAAGIALPVYEEIKLKNTVLNLDSVKRYLSKAHKIAVMDCSCRTKRKHCDAPLDVCITLNDAADWDATRSKSRIISVDEALKIVERAHAAGLVPMAYIRTDTPRAREIKADQTVLNFDNVKKYISGAHRIAVLDCDCRTKRKHCDAPLDVCIVLDSNADSILTSEKYLQLHPREVNVDEALNILKRFNEAGLVHMAYLTENKEKVETICSCCSCCCENMGAILRYGLAPHLLKASAKTTTDMSKCTGCGVCIDRCHFGAREIVNGELEYNKELCYGCGLCVSTCPTNAISLIQHQ